MNILRKNSDLGIFVPSLILVLLIGRIPYVNLFAHEFIITALIASYLVWQSRKRLDFRSSMYLVLGIFVFIFIVDMIGLHFYAEVAGNFVYFLLIFVTIPILFRKT